MTHYIDKDALIAEIESLLDKGKYHEEYDCAYRDGNNGALYALKGKVNTLEVKEVDIEVEVTRFVMLDPILSKLVNYEEALLIAKHFFALGLRSTITEEDCKLIWNIGDEIPCMVEEDFFKELLRRYKNTK